MVQGGWTPPSHHAVLDDHLTKLYATAESQLQSYVAALAERKRKAALLSDGKKMENGHPCVNFVFANNDGTMFCKNVDTFGHSKTAEWYAAEIKKIIEESGGSVPLVLVFSVTSNNSNGRFASYLHTPAYLGQPRQTTPHRPPSGGNGPGPGRITLRQCSHPVAKCCSASAPLLALRLWSGPVYPRVPPY